MSKLGVTPSQTVGPYFSFGLTDPWPAGREVVPLDTPGRIRVFGRVLDGAGAPLPDAMIETWQADSDGRFAHPDDPRGAVQWPADFRGFGRSGTDDEGRWEIHTLKPGRFPDREGRLQAPHLAVTVMSRGMLQRLVTRIYFGDEPAANAEDSVLASLPEDARATIVATPRADAGYELDIHLQGEHETAFFSV
jgi:protocatechuate 3,4-dioxygenase alpha subunit